MIPAPVEYVRADVAGRGARRRSQSPRRRRSPAGSRCIPVLKLRVVRPVAARGHRRARARRRRAARRRARARRARRPGTRSCGPPELERRRSRRSPTARPRRRPPGPEPRDDRRQPRARRPRVRPARRRARARRTARRCSRRGRARRSTRRDFFFGPFATALAAGRADHARSSFRCRPTVPAPPTRRSSTPRPDSRSPAPPRSSARTARSSVAVTGSAAAVPLPRRDTASARRRQVYGDRFAPAEYRRHLAGVVAERALERARSARRSR